MEKITDLQICGCVTLIYALETGQNELFSALFMALRMESGMDFDKIMRITKDIKLNESKTSFAFAGELRKLAAKKMRAMIISNN